MKRFVCNLIGLILAMTVCVYMTSCTKAKSHSFKIEFSIDGCPLSYNRTYYDGSSVVVNHIYSGDPTNPSFGDGKKRELLLCIITTRIFLRSLLDRLIVIYRHP